MTEDQFSRVVLRRLSNHFDCYTEVWGTHFTGQRKRIDAVIVPKEKTEWLNKDIKFGIEFKSPESEFDATKVSSLIRQAYDYIYTDWDEFGYMPVLICPFKVQKVYGGSDGEMNFLRRVIGKFGIGEIQNRNNVLTIVFQASHVIWDEYGVRLGSRWKFNYR